MLSSEKLSNLLDQFQKYPDLLNALSLTHLVHFVIYARALKDDILTTQNSNQDQIHAPEHIPNVIEEFLSKIIEAPTPLVHQCWEVLKHIVWETDIAVQLLADPAGSFKVHGRHCINTECTNHMAALLTEIQQWAVVFFTFSQGPVPAYTVHLYCRGMYIFIREDCTHNNGGVHYYYGSIPDVLQAGEHQFMERQLIDMWILDQVTSWKSTSNCARTYNTMFLSADHDNEDPEGRSVADHSDFHFSPNLRPELVWDVVILLCLVEDSASWGMSLDLSHTDEQETCLRKAMLACNICMQHFGLGQILHWCDKCTQFFDNRATGQGLCMSCSMAG
ncbi:hypothetical protein BC835DRAFT_1273596 [Cytidiella melzeri]|nr:hypothetical protein BC835DRAFT_1273596 [Cytidiella melzeri]